MNDEVKVTAEAQDVAADLGSYRTKERIYMTGGKNVFISWTQGNSRTRDLGRRLPLDTVFIYRHGNLAIRYAKQTLATWRVLRKKSPQVIVIMLPPLPLLLTVWFYARLHGCKLVADMHTGAFNDPRWQWSLPITMRLLRGHTAIVTNAYLANLCEAKSVHAEVLHDPIETSGSGHHKVRPNSVLCPVSYANDEPIDEMMRAARETPELEWVMTGKAPISVKKAAPSNVKFTGFVSDEEFNKLMEESGVVLALTTRPHTMQRAGYEALSFGKPQVTSDFSVLSDFLSGAALYTDRTAADITRCVKAAVLNREELTQEALRIRDLRITEQKDQLAKIITLAGSSW